MIFNVFGLVLLVLVVGRGLPPYAGGLLYGGLLLVTDGVFGGLNGWELVGHAAIGLLMACGYFYLVSALRSRPMVQTLVALCGGILLVLT
jgi:hypothetical protein